MEYSDLLFHNVQLTKLVSSADILFQHLYNLVSVEKKQFIDEWFCFKHEYDEACTSNGNSQFDVNENVQDCSPLSRIDEVSESEKISILSSASAELATHPRKADQLNENTCSFSSIDSTNDLHMDATGDVDNLSQFDSDLLEYMTDFQLITDGTVFDWVKTLRLNTSEIKQYMSWLESKDCERIWTDMCAKVRDKNDTNSVEYNEYQNVTNEVVAETARRFIPIETSHMMNNQGSEVLNTQLRNSTNYVNKLDSLHRHHEEIVDQHIRYLQEIRRILLRIKQEANVKFKNKDELHSSAEFHSFLKIDVAFEIIDVSIEMKNLLKLGHEIPNLATFNDKVDTIIDDCLRTLNLDEVRHLLFTFLNNVTVMRKCSSEHDKQVSELDREISNQKFLVWRLYMIINENKRSYENRCLTLHEQFEQKLQLIGKTTTDESNDESVAGTSGRALLPIMEKNSLHESTQSESKEAQNSGMSCVPKIPEKNLKVLQNASSSTTTTNTKVKRNKKKLIIMAQKH